MRGAGGGETKRIFEWKRLGREDKTPRQERRKGREFYKNREVDSRGLVVLVQTTSVKGVETNSHTKTHRQ